MVVQPKEKDKDTRTEGLLGDTTTGGENVSKMQKVTGGASRMDTVTEGATTGTTECDTTTTEAPEDKGNTKEDWYPTPLVIRKDLTMPKLELSVAKDVATFYGCDGTGSPVFFDLEIINDAWDEYVFRMKCTYGRRWFRADPDIGQINPGTRKTVRLWYANKKRHPAKGPIAPTPYFTIVYGPTANLDDYFDDDVDDYETQAEYEERIARREEEIQANKERANDILDGIPAAEMSLREECFMNWQQSSFIQNQIRIDAVFVVEKEKKKE